MNFTIKETVLTEIADAELDRLFQVADSTGKADVRDAITAEKKRRAYVATATI
jgi:hypothetical protein